MSLAAVRCVCAARAPRVAVIPQLLDVVAGFLVPHSLSALLDAVARGRFSLACSLLDALARDSRVCYLDKRLRARKAMSAAAFVGQVGLMEKLCEAFHCLIDEKMVREAVRGGSCEALRWLHAKLVAPPVDRGRGEGGEGQESEYTPVYSDFEMLQFLSRDLLAVAAENDDLEMLETLLELMRGHFESIGNMPVYRGVALQAAKVAARYGRARIVEWFRPRFDLPPKSEMDDEAHTGPLKSDEKTLGYDGQCAECHKADVDKHCTRWRMDNAASLGRLRDVQWFHTHRKEHGCSTRAMDSAAGNGHLDVVRWLHQKRREGCTDTAIRDAARNGYVEIVRFLWEKRPEARACDVLYWALHGGHLEVVQYLRSISPAWSLERPLRDAASGGHLHVIKWLLEDASNEEKRMKPVPNSWRGSPIDAAASSGHFDVVKYLFASMNQDDAVYDISAAASGNRVDIVRWFVEHQLDDDDDVGAAALQRNTRATRTRSHVSPALKKLTAAICSAARSGGNLEVIQYLHEHLQSKRVELNPNTATCFQEWLLPAVRDAASAGHLEVVKWLIRTEYRADSSKALPQALCAAVCEGRFSVVRWIWSHPALPKYMARKVDQSDLGKGMIAATEASDFAMLEWICARTRDLDRAFYGAISSGNIEMMQWLVGEALHGGGGATKRTLTAEERAKLARSAQRGRAWCIYKWLTSAGRTE